MNNIDKPLKKHLSSTVLKNVGYANNSTVHWYYYHRLVFPNNYSAVFTVIVILALANVMLVIHIKLLLLDGIVNILDYAASFNQTGLI